MQLSPSFICNIFMDPVLNYYFFLLYWKITVSLVIFFPTRWDVARNWGHLTRFLDLVTLISSVRINLLWRPFSWERVNTVLHEQIASFSNEKKIIPENWLSVDKTPSDPWISVRREGTQVEKMYYRCICGHCLLSHTTSISGLFITGITWWVSCCLLHLNLLWNFSFKYLRTLLK